MQRSSTRQAPAMRLAMLATGAILTATAAAAITSNVNNISGKLVVNGTGGNDLVVITRSMANGVQINGAAPDSGFFSADLITEIVVNAGSGDDIIDLTGVGPGTFAVLGPVSLNGGGGADFIIGSGFDDHIDGSAGADTIDGGPGGDTIHGGNQDDVLTGGDGNDDVDGEDGNDTVSGGNGNDAVRGGTGDDTVNGDAGADTVLGGAGVDTLFGQGGNDVLNGQGGADTANGGADDDLLIVESGNNDIANGDAGNDTFEFAVGPGTIAGDGGDGSDVVNVDLTGGDDIATLVAGQISGPGFGTVTWVNQEDVIIDGLGGNDDITVNGSDTTVLGGLGTDNFTIAAVGPTGLTVDGQQDDDTYSVTLGSLAGPLTVSDTNNGGPHPQDTDTLTVDAQGAPAVHTPGADGSGTIVNGGELLSYSGIENLILLNFPVPTLTEIAAVLLASLLALLGWRLSTRTREAQA